jgi:hypothetical protein
MKNCRYWLQIVLWTILALSLANCGKDAKSLPEQKESEKLTISAESLSAAHIVVEPAAGGEIVRTLSLQGEIKPNEHNSVKVTAGVGGVVRDFTLKQARVKVGSAGAARSGSRRTFLRL